MGRVRIGHASVTRVLELRFDLGARVFPRTPPSGWRDNADLLVPDFFNPDTDQWHIAIQSWVIEVDGLTVVVDTGVGNDRERPHLPGLAGLEDLVAERAYRRVGLSGYSEVDPAGLPLLDLAEFKCRSHRGNLSGQPALVAVLPRRMHNP